MGFFEKLKTFLETKIKLNFLSNNRISIIIVRNQKQNPVTYDEEKNGYIIDISKLSPKEYDDLKLITKEYVKDGNLLLESKSFDLLKELYAFKNTSDSTLEFFNGIIPLKIVRDDLPLIFCRL